MIKYDPSIMKQVSGRNRVIKYIKFSVHLLDCEYYLKWKLKSGLDGPFSGSNSILDRLSISTKIS